MQDDLPDDLIFPPQDGPAPQQDTLGVSAPPPAPDQSAAMEDMPDDLVFPQPPGIWQSLANSAERGARALYRDWQDLPGQVQGMELAADLQRRIAAGEDSLWTQRFIDNPELLETFRRQYADNVAASAPIVAEQNRQISALPQHPAAEAMQRAQTWGEAWDHFASAPLSVIANIGLESLVRQSPSLAIGAVAGAAGGVPALMASIGLGSAHTEYMGGIFDALTEAGVDITNADALRQALSNPKLMERIRHQSAVKAGVVGAFDAVSGGLASRVLLPAKTLAARPVARHLTNIGVQIPTQGAMGGAGEALGSVASGQEVRPGAVMGEIVGEAFGAPAEVLGARHARGRTATEPPPEDQVPPAAEDQVPPVPPQEPAQPQAAISGFYAPADRAIETSRRVQGPPQAWLNDLKKAGVSNDELDWMGFPQWMEENRGRPVSREEMAEFIRENGANLVEVRQDGEGRPREQIALEEFGLPWEQLTVRQRLWAATKALSVKYASNFPSGVTNPRNFLVQVPGLNYTSPHFGGPTISFIRVGDVTGPNGERTLLVHGNQSELHQEAEKSGYIGKLPPKDLAALNREADAAIASLPGDVASEVNDLIGRGSQQEAIQVMRFAEFPDAARVVERAVHANTRLGTVPDAPLKGDRWWQLGLKLALRQAVAEGYDAVAISTADQVKATDGNAPKSLYDSKMPSWLAKYVKPMGGVVETAQRGLRQRGPLARYASLEDASRALADAHGLTRVVVGNPILNAEEGTTLWRVTSPPTGVLRRTPGQDIGVVTQHRQPGGGAYYVADANTPEARDKLRTLGASLERPLVRITPQMRESISKGQPLFSAHNSPTSKNAQESALDAVHEGGTADVPIRVADGILNDIRSGPSSRYLQMVPTDYEVGSLIMLEHVGDGHPNGEVNAVFLTTNDTYTSMRLPLSALDSLGALHVSPGYTDSGVGGLFFLRFDLPGEFSKRLAGELRHEAGHALRSSGKLRGKVWQRLLGHAHSLSSMGMSVRDYLFVKGDAYWQNAPESTTVNKAYTRIYEGRPDFQEVMDQEHVMIMLELHHHGYYSDEQMAPIRDILDAMESGAVARGDLAVADAASWQPYQVIPPPDANAQLRAASNAALDSLPESEPGKLTYEDSQGGLMFALGGGGSAPSRGPSMAPAQSGAALRPVIADGTDPADARQQMEAILRDELGFASVSISPGAEERAEAGIKAYRLIAELAGIPPNAIGRRAQVWFLSTRSVPDMFGGLHFGYFKWISPASWFGRAKMVIKGERDSPSAAAEVAAHEWAHAFDHRAGQQQPVYRNFRAGGPKTLASTQFRVSRMFNPIRILGYVFPAVKPVTDVVAQERAWDFRRNYFWMRPEMGQAWLDLTSALSRGETGFFSRVSGLAKAGVTKLQGRSVGAMADAARERVQELEEKLEQVRDTAQYEVVLAELKKAEEARERLSDQESDLHERNETHANVVSAKTTFVDRSRRESRYHRKSYEMVARSFQTWLLDRAKRTGYDDSQLRELFPDARLGRQGLSFQPMLKISDENYDAVMSAWDRIFAALDVKPDSGQMMFAIGGGAPLSLVSFIRAQGGIRDEHGELSNILDRPGSKGYIPGIINNKTGVDPDRMRERLVEAGYLRESGPDQPAITSVNDVYDLVRRAYRGERVLPIGEYAEPVETRPDAAEIINQAVNVLKDAGIDYYLTEAEEARLVELVSSGVSLDDAIERATMESVDGYESGGREEAGAIGRRDQTEGAGRAEGEYRAELPGDEGAWNAGAGEGRAAEGAGTGLVPVTPPPLPPSSGGGSGMVPPGGGRGGRRPPPGDVSPPDRGGGPGQLVPPNIIEGERSWTVGDWMRAARDKWYSLGRTAETWWNPINGLPQLEQYRIGRYRMLGRIGHGEEMTKLIWRDFKDASKADKQAAYTYLTTRGASEAAIVDPKVRQAALASKRLFNALGVAAVERGLISSEALEKYRDRYLPRLYLEHILRKGSMLGFSGNARPSDLGWTKHRSDIDKETRVLMGEILDPGYLAARGIFRMHRDMQIIDFLSTISENDDWVFARGLAEFNGKRVSPYFLRAEAEALRERAGYEPDDGYRAAMVAMATDMETAAAPFIRENENVPNGYKQIPDTKRYGMLRGMYVRREIADDLLPTMSLIPEDANWYEKFLSPGGAGGKFNALWKAYHVPLNPSTQLRNIMSNAIMMNLSGMGPHRVAEYLGKAVKQMATNGPIYKIAVDMGLKTSGFSEQELRNVSEAWLKAEQALIRENAYGTLWYPWQIVKHVHDTILRKAGDLYNFSDGLFKVAMMIDAVERQGMTPEQGFLHAQKWLFDYSDVSKAVRYLRSSPVGIPFASYYYKALPRVIETAATKPWRFLPYVILPYVMGQLFMNAWNAYDDDEEKRKNPNRPNPVDRLAMTLPEYLRSKDYAFIMPGQDARGRWQFFDFGYLLPWSMFHETVQSASKGEITNAMRQAGFLGGPLLSLYQFVASKGTDSFTGRKVIDPRDPPSTQIWNTLGWMWDQTAPPLLTSKGALAKLRDAYNEVPERSGDPGLTMAQAMLRLFGFNVYPVDPDVSRGRQISRMVYEIKEAEKRRRSILRDQSLSPEARQREDDIRRMDILRRRRELQEYQANSEVHPRLRTERPQPSVGSRPAAPPSDIVYPQQNDIVYPQ